MRAILLIKLGKLLRVCVQTGWCRLCRKANVRRYVWPNFKYACSMCHVSRVIWLNAVIDGDRSKRVDSVICPYIYLLYAVFVDYVVVHFVVCVITCCLYCCCCCWCCLLSITVRIGRHNHRKDKRVSPQPPAPPHRRRMNAPPEQCECHVGSGKHVAAACSW